jgi:general secretion pathway protein J
MRNNRSKTRGFTLVEVLLASTIGAFIAMVAMGAFKAISDGAGRVDKSINMASGVRFAAKVIAGDLENLYRDSDLKNMKLAGSLIESSGGQVCDLAFYTLGVSRVRADEPEGDVYEVEYFLRSTDEKSVLMRRVWPNPDKEAQPGGVLSVLAEDIEVFVVRYFDGKDWQSEWPEEPSAIPGLVEVSIASKRQGSQEPVLETFIINFARLGLQRTEPNGSETQPGSEGEGSTSESSSSKGENAGGDGVKAGAAPGASGEGSGSEGSRGRGSDSGGSRGRGSDSGKSGNRSSSFSGRGQ